MILIGVGLTAFGVGLKYGLEVSSFLLLQVYYHHRSMLCRYYISSNVHSLSQHASHSSSTILSCVTAAGRSGDNTEDAYTLSSRWVQFFGVDPLRAGNVVQIIMVAGLTIGWISSYVFRVSNKDMTYAKQLKDYENKVMEVNPLIALCD